LIETKVSRGGDFRMELTRKGASARYRNWMLGREKDEKEGEGGASTAINRARIFTVAAAGRNARIWNFLDRPSSSNLEMLENCCSEAFPSPFELRR